MALFSCIHLLFLAINQSKLESADSFGTQEGERGGGQGETGRERLALLKHAQRVPLFNVSFIFVF